MHPALATPRSRCVIATSAGLLALGAAVLVVLAVTAGPGPHVASTKATGTTTVAGPVAPAVPPAPAAAPTPDGAPSPVGEGTPAPAWRPLVPGTSWQWQIDGEAIDETVLDGVDNPRKMYDVDLEATDAATIGRLRARGIYVVCYLETGGWESYRADADAYPESVLGDVVDGYPQERWVDIRQIEVLAPIVAARLDTAAAKGCDGIEPDLDDSYTADTGFALTRADQIAFNTAMIELAHARGMSMGLKNGPEIAEEMAAVADWALNESCNMYDECGGYAAFVDAGKAVFQVEYRDEGMSTGDFCPGDNAAGFDGILKESSDTLHALPRAACRFE